jgi:hypothetical protein
VTENGRGGWREHPPSRGIPPSRGQRRARDAVACVRRKTGTLEIGLMDADGYEIMVVDWEHSVGGHRWETGGAYLRLREEFPPSYPFTCIDVLCGNVVRHVGLCRLKNMTSTRMRTKVRELDSRDVIRLGAKY